MSHLYTIMPLDTEHVDEICEDIRWQYENGVADCALFMIKLVPEGDPVIDKAAIECEKYARFREKLESMGLSCGVLVQCTIGHGYALNQHRIALVNIPPMAVTPSVSPTVAKAEHSS